MGVRALCFEPWGGPGLGLRAGGRWRLEAVRLREKPEACMSRLSVARNSFDPLQRVCMSARYLSAGRKTIIITDDAPILCTAL